MEKNHCCQIGEFFWQADPRESGQTTWLWTMEKNYDELDKLQRLYPMACRQWKVYQILVGCMGGGQLPDEKISKHICNCPGQEYEDYGRLQDHQR